MPKKFIIIFSGLFLTLSGPSHIALADFTSPSVDADDEIEALQSQRAMAPLIEKSNVLSLMVENLQTPKMLMDVFFNDTPVKEQLTDFLSQDPISQVSTVYELGKSLYNDIQLLTFAHRIVFSPPADEGDAASTVQNSLKSQSLSERVEASLEKIGSRSIFQFQMIE